MASGYLLQSSVSPLNIFLQFIPQSQGEQASSALAQWRKIHKGAQSTEIILVLLILIIEKKPKQNTILRTQNPTSKQKTLNMISGVFRIQ